MATPKTKAMRAAGRKERKRAKSAAARTASRAMKKVDRQQRVVAVRAKYGPAGGPAPVTVRHVEPSPVEVDASAALARERDDDRRLPGVRRIGRERWQR